jgi:hypothetical protein
LLVSKQAAPNVAIAVLFVLLGGMLLLSVAPYELGTVRLAGVSLLWWYGLFAMPVAAVSVTVAALVRCRPTAPIASGERDATTPASE